MKQRRTSRSERLQKFLRELARADWSKLSARTSLACLPAIGGLLAAGLLKHDVRAGVIAAVAPTSDGMS